MLVAAIHPAAPAPTPHSSVLAWIVLAVVLGVVLACGMVMTSRR